MLTFEIQTEDDSNADRVVQKTLIAMESTIALNQLWLKDHPSDICFLTCGSVKYDFKRENLLSDRVDMKTIPILKKTKKGLCISFVCFDVAVRRMSSEDASPKIIPTDRPGVFHIVTIISGDRVVDPTKEIVELGSYKSAPAICNC